MRRVILLGFAGVALFSLGCARIQPIERPAPDFSASWESVSSPAEIELDRDWWRSFHSPQLDALIDEALRQSPDLLATAERVRQAELQLRITGASLFPAFNLGASTGSRRTEQPGGGYQTSDSTSATFSVNYEVDVWGGLSAGVHAAEAAYRATEYELESVRLSLAGAVASAWFQLLTLDERIRIARENILISERVMAVVETRHRNGVASAAEVARQQTNLLSQRAAVLPLELQRRQTRSALAVLLGRVPQNFDLADEQLLDLMIPGIDAGVPADILVRRPDLARAEAQLQIADANVAVARTLFLPRLSLGGSASMASGELFSLSNATNSVGWSMTLAQTLFDAGRTRRQRPLSESRQREVVEQYRRAILIALQETEDALGRVELNRLQELSQEEILIHAERSLRLTEVRYREGSDDLLVLLDAQRSVFQTRDQLAQLRLARLNAAVDLYRALGGGWSL